MTVLGFVFMYFMYSDMIEVARTSSLCVCLKEILPNLESPIFMEQMNSNFFLVASQTGIIRKYSEQWSVSSIFLNISDRVSFSNNGLDERGLVSFTLHPSHSENNNFFVMYVRQFDSVDYVVVSRFTYHNDNFLKTASSEELLLKLKQKSPYRNGGSVFFGTDGYLYISTGDGGLEGKDTEQGNPEAQEKTNLLGKVLRIDVDSLIGNNNSLPYGIPTDNPFIGNTSGKPEIFAYGFRNPFRCSVDKVTGTIWCGDTGNHDHDEVDIVLKGKNYGWNLREGNLCLQPGSCKDLDNEQLPTHAILHSENNSAVLGGYVYRGKVFPQLQSKYVYGDLIGGFRYLMLLEKKWTNFELNLCDKPQCPCNGRASFGTYIRSFAQDMNGEIYVFMTCINQNGLESKLLKMIPSAEEAVLCNKAISTKYSTVLQSFVVLFSIVLFNLH